MSEEVYGGSSAKKRWSPHEIKKMIKKMRNSYQKWDEIKRSAEVQHSYDESQATVELENSLQEIDNTLDIK